MAPLTFDAGSARRLNGRRIMKAEGGKW